MNNNNATIAKLQEMRLHGMISAFKSTLDSGLNQKFTPDELFAHMVDSEWDYRIKRKQESLRKKAGFRYQASFAEIDFTFDRKLDKNLILRLSDCSWIENHKDIIITGPTGIGKSFLGSALGHQACEQRKKVYYQSCSRLFARLKLAKADGSYLKELDKIQKYDVFLLEDFGLNPFNSDTRLMLLDILEDRHGRRSTIFISQIPVSKWHDLIGDSTIADAILDRIVYNSFRIELDGESIRKKMYRKS